jgi:glycosyltransferase involved in cell wall biosynthesis
MRIAVLTTDSRENYRDYASPTPAFGMAPQGLLHGFAALSAVEIHVVSCLQQPVTSPPKLAANIWFHPLHVPKAGWLRTGYQGCIRAVRRKLRAICPDIVHGQGTERDCALNAVFSGFPSVLTIHGNMRRIAEVNRCRPFTYGWLAARLERFTLPRAAGVVCLTEYARRAVSGLARRTWLVPNAVDETFLEIQPQPAAVPTILCVGTISLLKNQHRLIRALDPLAARRTFRLIFCGQAAPEDPYSQEFFRLIQGRPWCEFAGLVGRPELRAHFCRAALLVLPSVEDNCPMVVLEAMAAGVPVVAARVAGVPELIQDGVNGLLCDPLDLESIRASVQRVLEEEPLRQTLAARGRQHARDCYHPKRIAARHVEIYREVLSSVR